MTQQAAVAGVEIGGTKLQAALGRSDGTIEIIRRGTVSKDAGAQGILDWIDQELTFIIDHCPETIAKPSAIGVGFGGPVDSATGKVLTSHQIAGWQGIELKHWFEKRFGLPTQVINDANAAGWAEYCCGVGKGTRQFCYMNIGSGIGGALIVNGQLYDGQGLGAGEIGHTYVPDWSGAPGDADKLEHLACGWAIEKRIHALDIPAQTPLWNICQGHAEQLTCPMLAEAARQGDALALQQIEYTARSVGIGLANLITLFHPERIALGGGVSLMGDILLNPLRNHVDSLVFGPFKGKYEILPCALAESVVVAGALLLAPYQRTCRE
ncbi:MAG TPA: ROK family protein [Candidatus Hydrogenedentes bacterium]|nr:ROK family protein [Candidatus Hydrogenedentota bacterium]